MTTLKIESKPSTGAANALGRHVEAIYHTTGARRIGVVELVRTGRTEPDPGVDKDPSVSMRIGSLEIATPEQEDFLRQAMRALHLHRTAQGTLDETGDIELSERTLEYLPARLDAAEAARLRVGLIHWAGYTRDALRADEITLTEARHELDAIATGLESLLLLAPERP